MLVQMAGFAASVYHTRPMVEGDRDRTLLAAGSVEQHDWCRSYSALDRRCWVAASSTDAVPDMDSSAERTVLVRAVEKEVVGTWAAEEEPVDRREAVEGEAVVELASGLDRTLADALHAIGEALAELGMTDELAAAVKALGETLAEM